jgi:hypothetical protein
MAKVAAFKPAARDELQSPISARNAVVCIKAAARQLSDFPDLGRGMGDDSGRREIFAAFGAGAYALRYRTNAQERSS